MKSINIKLKTVDEIKEFVNIINKYDGEFDLVSEQYVIDAKSIMGIFGLDLSKPLKLDIHNNATLDNPEEILKDFICV